MGDAVGMGMVKELSARELLEKKKNEIKELEKEVKEEKDKEIYAYNKLGKKAQADGGIILKIGELLNPSEQKSAEVQ